MAPGRLRVFGRLALSAAVVWMPTVAAAATLTVNPGESIQAAVDAASPGDRVIVMPGDYVEPPAGIAAVRITKPLKLIARSRLPNVKVRILPNAGQQHGILVEPETESDPDINGLRIKGFTIQGFSNNGIWLKHVNHFKLIGNESIDNLENGIWPTLSANGLVRKNVAYGSQDSALWVEGSENVRVIKNDLHHSPTGLEITVSKNIEVKKNEIHHNTIGVGLYHPNAASLPPLGDDGDWHIFANNVHDNNEPNSAPDGTMSSALPTGGGILVLGVDRVTVERNQVTNNDFFGIGLVDWCLAVGGTPYSCTTNPPPPGYNSAPEDNSVIQNVATGNAGAPPASPFAAVAADIISLAPLSNCFIDNTFGTSFPDPLPPCS